MHTPQNNPGGYENSSIHDVKALSQNVRFLVMHGIADDNVHMQNTATLLDKLDLDGIENYDVHFFPDSDHSIYFHNANKIVYDSEYRLSHRLMAANKWCRVELMARQCVQRGVVKDTERSPKGADRGTITGAVVSI